MNTPSFLRLCLAWYVVKRPRAIVRSYFAYASVFAEVFSFVFLLRTLFAPWKDIRDDYPRKGFDLNRILQTWMFNIIVRSIGGIIRIGAIVTGLLIQAVLLAGFTAYLAVWYLFPFLLAAGIPFLLGLL